MKEKLIVNIVLFIIGCVLIVVVVKTGVLNLAPPQDTANLEARVKRLEQVTGIEPNGRLVIPDFEKARP